MRVRWAVGKVLIRGLRMVFGLGPIEPAWAEEFAREAYRVSADRAVRVSWAVLAVTLPLFYVVDWRTFQQGSWALQPAHERIFWWRVGATVFILALLALRALMRKARTRDAVVAWSATLGYALLGAWFAAVCQTLMTDASIYVLFLVGASVLFPIPTLLKLLVYPLALGALLAGLARYGVDGPAGYHVVVDIYCATIGALVTEAVAMRTFAAMFVNSRQLDEERRRTEEILGNVLPPTIVQRIKERGTTSQVQYHPEVSILFADFVGFGELSRSLSPAEMIGLLDTLFVEFDEAAERFGVEKIKTLGDSYMAACGVPHAVSDHAQRIAEVALRIRSIAERVRCDLNLPVHFRLGLHTGPAIAGVIGRKTFHYDLWGDTVNLACHLRSTAEPGSIHVSRAMRESLDGLYRFEMREPISIKRRADIQTYNLLGRVGEERSFRAGLHGERGGGPTAVDLAARHGAGAIRSTAGAGG